jgi:hypothetical protein
LAGNPAWAHPTGWEFCPSDKDNDTAMRTTTRTCWNRKNPRTGRNKGRDRHRKHAVRCPLACTCRVHRHPRACACASRCGEHAHQRFAASTSPRRSPQLLLGLLGPGKPWARTVRRVVGHNNAFFPHGQLRKTRTLRRPGTGRRGRGDHRMGLLLRRLAGRGRHLEVSLPPSTFAFIILSDLSIARADRAAAAWRSRDL